MGLLIVAAPTPYVMIMSTHLVSTPSIEVSEKNETISSTRFLFNLNSWKFYVEFNTDVLWTTHPVVSSLPKEF